MPDAKFSDPRLAPLYDLFEGDRADLDAYVSIVEEFDAGRSSTSGAARVSSP